MPRFTALNVLLVLVTATEAFVLPNGSRHAASVLQKMTQGDGGVQNNSYLNNLSAQNPNMGSEPRVNPSRPELPEIPGDYDWDEKFKNDPDWLTGTSVPGKAVLSQEDLAKQASDLAAFEKELSKKRDIEEYEDSINVGFVRKAEIINGRTAMFFLVTGLLTEYWTGVSLPGQVEEMLRIGGFIGFD